MKQIKEYPNYSVTEDGRVISTQRVAGRSGKGISTICKELSILHNQSGYCMVNLTKEKKSKTRYVHRLVAQAYLENQNNLPQVNHKDGNKDNNHYTNLEWCTSLHNNLHALEKGLRTGLKGETNSQAKITELEAIEIIKLILEGLSNIEIADMFDLHDRYVSLIRGKKRWKSLWDSHFSESSAPISKKLSQRDLDAENLIKDVLLTSLSNADIGRKYLIDPSTISKIRTGKRIPDRYKLFYDKYTKRLTTIEHQESELVE